MKETEEDYIILKKSEIREVVKNTTDKILDGYNSPFTKVEVNSDDFIVDTKDLEITKLNEANTKRGFIMFMQEKISNELISYLKKKMDDIHNS